MNLDPRSFYSARLAERQAEIAAKESRGRSLGYWRLASATAAVIIVLAALTSQSVSVIWAAIPAVVFVVLAVVHERLLRSAERRRRAARFYERGIARLDNAWQGSGETGESYLDPAHPYALDLDLFGKGSVFELLCTARTHIGEGTLARWLLQTAPPTVVVERQKAVDELRPQVELREDLFIAAETARTGIDPESLAAWGERPPLLEGGWRRAGIWALSALGTLGLISFFVYDAVSLGVLTLGGFPASLLRDFFLLALVVNCVFLYRSRQRVAAVVNSVEEAAHELQLLSETLFRLERERFRSPLLVELRKSLDAAGDTPSKRMARLNRLVQLLDSRDHVLVRVAEPFALWTAQLAWSVEDWRRTSGKAVRRWLNAVGEMEALSSLASHGFEHPADPFPEFVDEGPWLQAEAAGHPLLAEDKVVRNDVTIGGELRVLIVSGSNMSGKSTLLRTLGVNTVLAQAGAPVRARRFRISRLSVGASIRVSDSLQGGVSRFYAEILRLRRILDETQRGQPVLFLIDEFLHGTNSHDRKIGAEAVVRGLVERGAIGLITTHDLALAHIADSLGARAANVHFEDRIEDGRILFDYVMRPGIVHRSNAIELMRSVGLEI